MERQEGPPIQALPGELTPSSVSPSSLPLPPVLDTTYAPSTAEAHPEEAASPTRKLRAFRDGRWLPIWAIASVLVLVSALVLFQEDSAAEQPNVTLTEADVSLPPPKQLPGFENSELPNGWTLYTSETEGFSIALPPGWRTDIRDDLGPTFRFYATDLLPTYAPITAGATPGLFVMRNTTYVGEDPARFWDNVRQQYAAGDTEVELSQSHLRDGVAYVFTTINEVAYGEQAETTYGLLRGVAVYRLVFTVPSPYLDEYEDVFHDIAMTFDIAG